MSWFMATTGKDPSDSVDGFIDVPTAELLLFELLLNLLECPRAKVSHRQFAELLFEEPEGETVVAVRPCFS